MAVGVSTEITAACERWQEPGREEQWSDSFYFGGGDGEGLAFYSRAGRRPNEGVTEGDLGRWVRMLGDPCNFLVVNNVGTGDGGEVAGGFIMRDGELAPIEACETESEL